jgi:hypothetical protein
MGTDRARLASEDRYTAIAELARIEHRLLDDGRLEELEALEGRWSELTEDLPGTPPAHAREPLKRALATHVRIGELLLARRAAILAELAALARAGRAADGYARSAMPSGSSVDHSA